MKKYFFVLIMTLFAVIPLKAQDGMLDRGSPEGAFADDGPASVGELQAVDMNGEDMDELVLAANDQGDWSRPEFKPHGSKGGPCEKLKLDDSQKAKMREAFFNFREKQIDLQAQLKKAHLKLKKIMTDPTSEAKSAESASQDVREALSRVIAAKQEFKILVQFKILNADQRKPAMMCAMHRHHRGHHHGGDDRFAGLTFDSV